MYTSPTVYHRSNVDFFGLGARGAEGEPDLALERTSLHTPYHIRQKMAMAASASTAGRREIATASPAWSTGMVTSRTTRRGSEYDTSYEGSRVPSSRRFSPRSELAGSPSPLLSLTHRHPCQQSTPVARISTC